MTSDGSNECGALRALVTAIADAIVALDGSRIPFKTFQPGAGPYGEPQLVKAIAAELDRHVFSGLVTVRRSPDMLITGKWAVEFKIARPFGDNGKPAENWSVNLLHPYPGNQSAIGDCLKLRAISIPERRAAIVIGYEHTVPLVELEPLVRAFEVVARQVCGIDLGEREELVRDQLVHPVHQRLRVIGWEVAPAI